MAHFAKLTDDNLVLHVEVVEDSILEDENGVEQESLGVAYLTEIHGWPHWKQTSYNTKRGKYWEDNLQTVASDQSKAFRKNFASIGGKYDSTKDAFIPEQPFNSWTLDETTCTWVPPITEPIAEDESKRIYWNESNQSWDAEDVDGTILRWNTETSSWSAV